MKIGSFKDEKCISAFNYNFNTLPQARPPVISGV